MVQGNDEKAFGDAAAWLPVYGKSRRAIMLIDMVESVRMIAADEAGVIGRWQQFNRRVRHEVLPAHGGELVKSTGDGMLLTFTDSRRAVGASRDLQALMDEVNRDMGSTSPAAEPIALRIGINVGEVSADDIDIYGHSVNLAARIMSHGSPGETLVSADVCDALVEGIDGDIEDLGECYLKHVEEPVRIYRVGRAAPEPALPARREHEIRMQTTVAVIPFGARSSDPEHFAIGELIADGVIAQLSRTRELRVISRLSTTALRGEPRLEDVERHLGAAYALSGSYAATGSSVIVTAELVNVKTTEVVWVERLTGSIGDLLQERSETCNSIAGACHRAILDSEATSALLHPLPTLQSYSLLLGGIGLMHRSSPRDFLRTGDVLRALAERHSRHPLAHVWLAKWYVLRATRGLVADGKAEAAAALDHTRRALDQDPNNGLALAMQGFVYCHLVKDIEKAQAVCETAVASNESEPLAWLFKGMIHAFDGDGARAHPAGMEAARLSPIDPLRYYFDSLLASISISAGRYDEAIAAARRALKANAIHLSTYRALALAQSLSGRTDDARQTLQRMYALDPGFTIERFAANYPSRDRVPEYLAKLVEALRAAGVRER